jgi:uncharacterized membrane protein YkvA (DUF1232 family)
MATAPTRPPRRGGGRLRHPLIRLAGTVARLPRYLKLAQGLARESAVAPRHKAALGLGIGYAVLPFDLLPGVIPVVGQLDDLAALLLGIRHTLRACPPDVAAAHLARAGLKATALDDDLRVVAVATVWLVSSAGSLSLRAARAPGRLLARVRGQARAAAPPAPPASEDAAPS